MSIQAQDIYLMMLWRGGTPITTRPLECALRSFLHEGRGHRVTSSPDSQNPTVLRILRGLWRCQGEACPAVGVGVLDGQVARMAFFPTKPENQRL